jgi:formylglycine-generating enzyme required for sulfatase activity
MGNSGGPQTVVTITNGFFMGKMLVTQREYLAVRGVNPSWFNGDRTPWGSRDFGINLDRPVETVNSQDATNYLDQFSQLEQQVGRLPAGWIYRLPSEAEWEYACRAGTTTRFFFGDDPSYNLIGSYVWYNGNSDYVTQTVGTKSPNPWGLYDMGGNVKEWCVDVYPSDAYRAVRGGSCIREASYCQSGFRDGYHWFARANDCGFRVMLALAQP